MRHEMPYLSSRRAMFGGLWMQAALVKLAGIMIGIELDGHAHG
ncbi:hypothetical protein [Parasedimentitalea maritima]|nr:hypothetical protein [Zongyanglinia marina]